MFIHKRNEKIFTNVIKLTAFAAMGMFAACGGDSDSSAKADNADGREVATLAEMGRCTSDRNGDTVYVAEKLTDYLCQNGSWVDLSEIPDGTDLKSSSSSGTSSGDDADSTKGFVRENISVTGVAQKGPFQFGSPLTLQELKKDLTPSGLVYNDEINSNKGDFVIPKVTLAHPYAKLEVRGLYRNEVTGNWSTDSMTLRALTDFSDKRTDANTDDRAQVNINLLTHLEYDRALYLVQEKGYSVYAAKKQAAQEIMTAFEFATAVTYSEDFAIFQNDGVGANTIAGNGTLLAISALVMGNRSDVEIQSAIDKFIADITTDGEWNDLQTKADMADWAYDFDYKTIRASVKSWNILDIPDYETYLDIYWNNVYGLGGCSEIRKGIVAPNSNKLSKYYNEYFICAEVAPNSYKWMDATTFEKDTYGWIAGKNGEFEKGNVTDTIYVCKDSNWVVAERETAIGLCTESKVGKVSVFDSVYYICRDNAWKKATVLEYDTYGLTGKDGDVKPGVVNKDKYYVFDNGKWRASNEQEVSLGVCATAREGEVSKSGTVYYICKSKTWTEATALEYDTYGLKVGTDGEVKAGIVNTDKYYVYENGAWRTSASEIENNLGGCVTSREGNVGKAKNIYYICKSKTWTEASVFEYDTYGWEKECSNGEVKAGSVNAGNYYICKSKTWTTATVLEYDTYGWKAGTEGEVKTGNVNTNKYYVYENGAWRAAANEMEKNLGACVPSRDSEIGLSGGIYYICKSRTWTTATEVEKDLGGCVASREGEVGKSGNTYYICKSRKWTTAIALEYDTYGKVCLTDGSIVDGNVISTNKYVCDDGEFREAEKLEISLDKGCVNYTKGTVIRKAWIATHDTAYRCNSRWIVSIELSNGEYGTLIDIRDNKTYRTIVIGNQVWMAENLNYGDSLAYDSMKGRSLCYENRENNCNSRLYAWLPSQEICPEGWHLPSKEEWETLFTTVGGTSTAGDALKSLFCGGSDAFGFNALFAGYGYERYDGEILFEGKGSSTGYWSSTTSNSSNYAYAVNLGSNSDFARLNAIPKSHAFSVRCVKD